MPWLQEAPKAVSVCHILSDHLFYPIKTAATNELWDRGKLNMNICFLRDGGNFYFLYNIPPQAPRHKTKTMCFPPQPLQLTSKLFRVTKYFMKWLFFFRHGPKHYLMLSFQHPQKVWVLFPSMKTRKGVQESPNFKRVSNGRVRIQTQVYLTVKPLSLRL